MIELTVSKTSDSPSVFSLSPQNIDLGGKQASGVDFLRVSIPPDWQGKTVRITFVHAANSQKVAVILPETGIVKLTSDITSCNGDIVIDAAGTDNYAAYSTGCHYTVYNHPDTGSNGQVITPDEYHQFVGEVKDYSDSAQASTTAADASKTAAEAAASAAQAANIVNPQSWTDAQKLTARTNINAVSPSDLTAGDWIIPTLINGWTQYNATLYPVKYYKDCNGIVHLRGRLSGGSAGEEAFILPTGYRVKPRASFSVPNLSSSLVVTTDIAENGSVFPSAIDAYNIFVDISGITFRAEA